MMLAPQATYLEDLERLWHGLGESRASALRAVGLAAGILRGLVVLRGAKIGHRVYVGGPLRLVADGEIQVGDMVCFFGGMLPTEVICHAGASLSIGAGSELNYGVSIEAGRRIQIGERCKIGSMVRIADVSKDGAAPIVIGSDVWIAHGAILEPGVSIGDGSVVSAGSVVTTSIPGGSLAVGNPARPVRLDVMARAASREDHHA